MRSFDDLADALGGDVLAVDGRGRPRCRPPGRRAPRRPCRRSRRSRRRPPSPARSAATRPGRPSDRLPVEVPDGPLRRDEVCVAEHAQHRDRAGDALARRSARSSGAPSAARRRSPRDARRGTGTRRARRRGAGSSGRSARRRARRSRSSRSAPRRRGRSSPDGSSAQHFVPDSTSVVTVALGTRPPPSRIRER